MCGVNVSTTWHCLWPVRPRQLLTVVIISPNHFLDPTTLHPFPEHVFRRQPARSSVYLYTYVYSSGPPVGAVLWRLSAIAPLKSLDKYNGNNQWRQYWESCVGCRYIAVLFPAGKYRGTINRWTTATVFHTARHSTTRVHHSNAQPKTTAQLTGGKRSHDGCQPGTLWGHRESFALTRASRDCPLYSVYTCCFKTFLLF